MNQTMKRYTYHLFIKGGISVFTAALAWGIYALALRYNQALHQGIQDRKKITVNQAACKQASANIQTISQYLKKHTVTSEVSVPTQLFNRLDQLKQQLHPQSTVVSALEKKPEGSQIKFSLKLSATNNYQDKINILGQLETEIFPFIIIDSLSLHKTTAGLQQAPTLAVEGSIFLPNQTSAPDAPSGANKKQIPR